MRAARHFTYKEKRERTEGATADMQMEEIRKRIYGGGSHYEMVLDLKLT